MHDGQNLFDAATAAFGVEWQADEIAERLIEAGKIEPLIIVGIYNSPDRLNEYSMERDGKRKAGGRGGDYAKFLIEEVIPLIDKTYRTKRGREHTGVGGSSMGGLISLEIAMTHPDKFSRCAVVSPSLMWNDGSVIDRLRKDASPLKRTRIWLDMGTNEGHQIEAFSTAVRDARELAEVLKNAGLKPDRDFKYLEVKNGEHNEASWAGRFDQILTFLFAERKD
jgi:predicted alpha/beta superfamily hydrolase